MTDTKENILMTSLRLFAQDGYEAVSVSKIAGELGMTKGALYKHYKNKHAIFDSIFERLCRLDIERSKEAGLPEQKLNESPFFQSASVESVKAYMVSQFFYWTEDETACNFRKMLTLEQYRNPEMTKLYQKVLTGGPVAFMETLFYEMMEQGTLRSGSPEQMAIEFYAPFYLLLNLSDAARDKEEKDKIKNLFLTHIDCFTEKYAAEEP